MMSNIEKLKLIKQGYNDLFNKDKAGFKWKKDRRYAWAQIVSSLDLAIKYCQEFEKEEKCQSKNTLIN